MTLAEIEVSVRAVLRQRLRESDDPDPAEAVAELVAEWPEHRLREALESTLHQLARHELHTIRRQIVHRASSDNGSARWDEAAAMADVFRIVVSVNGEDRFLGDCTAAEVATVAEGYAQRAADEQRWADRYGRVSALVAKRKATVVSDLPASLVAKALSS